MAGGVRGEASAAQFALPVQPAEGRGVRRALGYLTACLCVAVGVSSPARADDYEEYFDERGDVLIRRTDTDANGTVDPLNHRPADLLQITIGAWKPRDACDDLFRGDWDEQAATAFLRVDLVFDERVNPPGPVDLRGGGFDPFRFGPHPVLGFVEMDADENINSGGEIRHVNGDPTINGFPELRPLGAAGRFGGVPGDRSELRDRYARGGEDFDGKCDRGREVEYSGEEFHIALQGEEYAGHVVIDGDGDAVFESGETWDVSGTWLHRAHGFEPFSFAEGRDRGVYDPESIMRWSHNLNTNRTTATLLFPLTQRASAAWRCEPRPEPIDRNPYNQASVEEALADLRDSARFWRQHNADCTRVILDWADTDPEDVLRPRKWTVLALLGTSYTVQDDGFFVWTDVFPSAEPGDVNGESGVDDEDFEYLYEWVRAEDGGFRDGDGGTDGRVTLIDFGPNFCVYDVNYDGVVDVRDAAAIITPGDMDGDRDVDGADWTLAAPCLRGPQAPVMEACTRLDFDFDGDVDLRDVAGFAHRFGGG